ncbi:MAG: fibronectin type III domain-containing protein [Planctomycetota bacterium]
MLLLVAALTLGVGAIGASGEEDEEEEGEEIELDEASVFIEWNSTDTDFGIQVFWDGEPWDRMKLENPDGQQVMDVHFRKNLKAQGMTEGFFESAEPPASELSMKEFFERHPEGTYEFEGTSLEGDELEGEAEFTHDLPAPPKNLKPAAGDVVSHKGFTVSFDAVTKDIHGDPIDIEFYEVVVEKEDDDPILQTISIILRPSQTSVEIPGAFLEPGTEYKLEVIAQEESGNRTITETGLFETDEK